MRSMAIPRRSHHTELGKIEQGIGTGKRHAIVGPNGKRQAALAEQALEGGHGRLLARGVERLAQQQEARGMIADGQREAVMAVAKLELAFEVGAPDIVRGSPLR